MASLAPVLKHQFFDDNGDPLSGGKLYSYLAGTSTPAATYTDESGDTPNTNPIILDAAGRCDLWLFVPNTTSYKFVMRDADDVVQWTVDDVQAPGGENSAESGAWTEHAITGGQSATDLEGETLDLTLYSSGVYDVEIIRGTSIFANGQIAIQNPNGTARVKTGMFMSGEAHGVTFSVDTDGTTAQLKAAVAAGDNGTIKLSRRVVPVSS